VATASQRKGVGCAPATQKTAPALIDRHPTDQPDRRQQPIPAYVLLNALLNAQERFVGTLALPRQVSWDCLVSFRGCRYSVLLSMVGLARTRFAGRTPKDRPSTLADLNTSQNGVTLSSVHMPVAGRRIERRRFSNPGFTMFVSVSVAKNVLMEVMAFSVIRFHAESVSEAICGVATKVWSPRLRSPYASLARSG
jgi:hypothetical protein